MVWNRLLRIVMLVVCGAILVRAATSSAAQETLQSFYIVRSYFSDYIPGWGETILDVAPQGGGVRVRMSHINQANDYCPGLIVRSAEDTFPDTSVKQVAGSDMCAFTSRGVAAALKAARPKYGYDTSDSATIAIVATCGTRQREFDFPYPANVDRKKLKRSNPKVSDLWDTYYRTFGQAFGNDFSFNKLTPDQERQMEQLGTELVPELISGKYQTAFAGSRCGDHECDNYMAWFLQGYEGPQSYDPLVVTLLDADALHLTKYVPPTMNRLAMMVRMYGDVRLRILVDPQTGLVRNVEAVSGYPLWQQEAVKAAQSWQFAPDALSGDSVEATLRFELRCR